MDSLQLYGHIDEGGALHVSHRELLNAWVKAHPGKRISLRIERTSSRRSEQQNRYYWGVVIKAIGERLRALGHCGFKDEEVHEYMKLKFNCEQIVGEGGEILELPRSTSGLSKTEFASFMDNVRTWAADFLHIAIPHPSTINLQ